MLAPGNGLEEGRGSRGVGREDGAEGRRKNEGRTEERVERVGAGERGRMRGTGRKEKGVKDKRRGRGLEGKDIEGGTREKYGGRGEDWRG